MISPRTKIQLDRVTWMVQKWMLISIPRTKSQIIRSKSSADMEVENIVNDKNDKGYYSEWDDCLLFLSRG